MFCTGWLFLIMLHMGKFLLPLQIVFLGLWNKKTLKRQLLQLCRLRLFFLRLQRNRVVMVVRMVKCLGSKVQVHNRSLLSLHWQLITCLKLFCHNSVLSWIRLWLMAMVIFKLLVMLNYNRIQMTISILISRVKKRLIELVGRLLMVSQHQLCYRSWT